MSAGATMLVVGTMTWGQPPTAVQQSKARQLVKHQSSKQRRSFLEQFLLTPVYNNDHGTRENAVEYCSICYPVNILNQEHIRRCSQPKLK